MTLISAIVGLTLVSGTEDAVRIERTFRAGEQDVYAVQLQATAEALSLDAVFKVRQTVKRVFGPERAQVQSEILDFASASNGEARKPDPSRHESAEFRFDCFGLAESIGGKCPAALRLIQYSGLIGDQPLRKGQAVECSLPATKAGTKAFGRVLLETLEDGIGKLVSNWHVQSMGDSPVRIDMTSFVEVPKGRLIRASGTIVPEAKGAPVQAIQFSIQRETK